MPANDKNCLLVGIFVDMIKVIFNS